MDTGANDNSRIEEVDFAASDISHSAGIEGSAAAKTATTQQQECMFDDFHEVDTEDDKPYFLTPHPLSVLGYLPSDNEDETNCVLCKYVNPKHHLEQVSRPQRPTFQRTKSETPDNAEIIPSLKLAPLLYPRKRTLSGLASSKYNPERNVKLRVDVLPGANPTLIKVKRNDGNLELEELPTGLDGGLDSLAFDEQHLSTGTLCHSAVDKSDVLYHATLAGRLISDAERRSLQEQEALHASQLAIMTVKRIRPRHCHSKPVEEDHHSLEGRIRREADTTTLMTSLARADNRRNSESYRVKHRMVVKRACPQCQDEQLVSPLQQEENLPCLHRPLTRTGKPSMYRIQQAEDVEVLILHNKQPAPRATRKIKPIAQTWCYCGNSEKGKVMYRCRNEECFIGWFHDQCLRVLSHDRTKPWRKGEWYCNHCDPETPNTNKKEDRYTLSFSKEQINEAFGFSFGRTDTAKLVGDVYGLGSISIEK